MNEQPSRPFLLPVLRPPGPGFTDGLVLAIGILFVLAGLWMLATGRDPSVGVTTLVFFGLCTAVAVWQLRQKLGHRRFDQTRGVTVAGGQRIPMRKGRQAAIASGMLVVGVTGVLASGRMGVLFGLLSGAVGVFAATLLVRIALGRVAADWIAFEPEGLRFGRLDATFFVHWDNIAGLATADIGGNPVLAITVADEERLLTSVDPLERREKLAGGIRSNRTWLGCDLTVMPFHYGTDLATLTKAVEGYARDPAARRELAPRTRLPAEGKHADADGATTAPIDRP